MTDLKGYCLTCGKHTLNPGGFHSCHEHPVIAYFKARIAKLEAAGKRLTGDGECYKEWFESGGEPECPHGFHKALACYRCDVALFQEHP